MNEALQSTTETTAEELRVAALASLAECALLRDMKTTNLVRNRGQLGLEAYRTEVE